MKNRNLSASAKNITIIARDGMVTLRGSVRNLQEMAEIVTAARKIAGANKVDDQLDALYN